MKNSIKLLVINGWELFFCICTILISQVFWMFKPSDTLPMPIFTTVVLLLFWSFIFMLKAFIMLSFDSKYYKLPKLKKAQDSTSLIFESSEHFKIRAIVSIHVITQYSDTILGYGIINSKLDKTDYIEVKIKHIENMKKHNFLFFQNADNVVISQTVLYEDLTDTIINKIRGI